MKSFISGSLEDTAAIASKWLADLSNAHTGSKEAVVVGLSGHLGAGKTAFVKEIAKILGIEEDVTSPTFVIMKIYELQAASGKSQAPWKRLVHIDAYRLERSEELEALDFEALVSDMNNLILIEWPENVGLAGFKELCSLKLDIQEGKRIISVR